MFKRVLCNQKGVSIVLLAMSIILLFGFGALVIDIGHLYSVKDQLQNAADAAALAGAAGLTGNTDIDKALSARKAAFTMAAKNYADVAVDVVPSYKPDGFGGLCTSKTTAGSAIPVALDPTVDIEVGNYDKRDLHGTNDYHFLPNTTPYNAVRVTTNRTGNNTSQPRAQNWFAKIFKLLGADYDLSSISAVAIAASEPKGAFLPIAVNEYWLGGAPYPQSYMRAINADADPITHVSPTTAHGGQIFAILGQGANDNQTSNDVNSYVDILFRNKYHKGKTANWWQVNTSGSGNCSPSCESNLTPWDTTKGLKTGDISGDAQKYGDVYQYFFTGIPDSVIPPNAVREIIRTVPVYPFSNYSSGAPYKNDPSQCPYATVPYFPSSGDIVTQPKGPGKQRFCDKWKKDDKFIVMVYDGTFLKRDPPHDPDKNQAQAVTIVGYGIIQLDGYINGTWNKTDTLDPGGSGKPGGNTAYGHAIKHGIAGADDEYIIQPSDANRTPDCSFTTYISQLQATLGGQVHLVGACPQCAKYGMGGTGGH